MIDDCYINDLAKIYAVFHSRVIRESVSLKLSFVWRRHVWCPSEGHQHGGCKVTETSVIEKLLL